MKFTHNATNFFLLTNKPITFKNKKEEFSFFPPTLEDIMTSAGLSFIVSFLEEDVEKYARDLSEEIKDHYDFLHLAFSLRKKVEAFEELSEVFLEGMVRLVPDFHFDGVFKIKDIFVSKALLQQIFEVFFLSIKRKVVQIKEEDDEMTKRMKKAEMKAKKIKESKEKESDGNEVERMIAAVLYEFPQYKIEDLLEMNLYTFYFLFGYVGRIANYEISKIAVGQGLLKGNKHKYFTE